MRFKFLALTVALLFLVCEVALAQRGRGSSSSSKSSSKSSTSKTSDGKTVHVKGHTRKDGTYVGPYDRRPPGTATSSETSTVSSTPTRITYKRNYLAAGVTPHPTVLRDKHGKIKRSAAAKNGFQREHPCPSTGSNTGRCPGYVIDHVNPLECGGADAPLNMQWQTVAAAKAKDRTEGSCHR